MTAIRAIGTLLGRRILIILGRSGRFAGQLAHLAGAHVIASVGTPERGAGLTELGADQIVVGLDNVTQLLDGVTDNVGGAVLTQALSLLASSGSLQSVGVAPSDLSTSDFQQQRLPE